jgi:hypothetical protein
MLDANSWDTPEVVEVTTWWKTLSKYDTPATAIALSHDQSLAVLSSALYLSGTALFIVAHGFLSESRRNGSRWLLAFSCTARLLASCGAFTRAQGVGKLRRTLAIKNKLSEGGSRS